MKHLILSFIVVTAALAGCDSETAKIRVMSFNLWHGGDGCGLSRVSSIMFQLEAIRQAKADIVGFQEQADNSNGERGKLLADSLHWQYYKISESRAIISRFSLEPIKTEQKQPANHHGSADNRAQAVLLSIDSKTQVVFGVLHLMYTPYEPYDVADKKLKNAGEAEASATKARLHEVNSMLESVQPYLKKNIPVILAGDFNEPSCLDWTTSAIQHRKDTALSFAVNWPASRLLLDNGFEDAFRKIHPGVETKPAYTWTSRPGLWRIPEIHDRIDLVHTTKENIIPAGAWVVGERSPHSDIVIEPWPSDHRAVVVELTIQRSNK